MNVRRCVSVFLFVVCNILFTESATGRSEKYGGRIERVEGRDHRTG